jgi:hypothetical protein
MTQRPQQPGPVAALNPRPGGQAGQERIEGDFHRRDSRPAWRTTRHHLSRDAAFPANPKSERARNGPASRTVGIGSRRPFEIRYMIQIDF